MNNPTTKFKVKNWAEFQHYKDRNPPWIKLHFALLASEDWVLWNDASKLLAIACMLIASRNDGYVPNNPAYLKRVAYLDMVPDFEPLISCGFLEIPLADASIVEPLQATARPETETETETETEENRELSLPSAPVLIEAHRLWNNAADSLSLSRAQALNQTRKLALRKRLGELGGLEGWRAMLEIIGKSPHLLGENDRGWKATFDWILKPANLTKVMEGNYVRARKLSNWEIADAVLAEQDRREGICRENGEDDILPLPEYGSRAA